VEFLGLSRLQQQPPQHFAELHGALGLAHLHPDLLDRLILSDVKGLPGNRRQRREHR